LRIASSARPHASTKSGDMWPAVGAPTACSTWASNSIGPGIISNG
jgi:hypothetical protein